MSFRARILPAVLVSAALALTGCSTGSTDSSADNQAETKADKGAFPVTIKHAFGETTVKQEPKRVATLGWTDQDHVLALGVVPVGATKITWGGNAAGSTDWFDEELKDVQEDVKAETPVRYDDTDGVPVDEVAKTKPDLILAVNSGLTEDDYKKLTEIAPVVAYPEAPWVTDWQTSLETIGKALGRSTEAADVKQDMDEDIAEARKENPELEGKTMIYGYLATTDLSQVGVYASQDPRVAVLREFGLKDAPAVAEVVKPGEFYGQISAERAADLQSDVFLTWTENPGDADTLKANKLISQIPAIKAGHFWTEADKQIVAASTNPTPLSIDTITDKVLPTIVKAVQGS